MKVSKPHSSVVSHALKTLREWDHLGTANTLLYDQAIDNLEEQFEALQSAAMRLCNAHRWSYGGPETLVALANRIAKSNPAKSPH